MNPKDNWRRLARTDKDGCVASIAGVSSTGVIAIWTWSPPGKDSIHGKWHRQALCPEFMNWVALRAGDRTDVVPMEPPPCLLIVPYVEGARLTDVTRLWVDTQEDGTSQVRGFPRLRDWARVNVPGWLVVEQHACLLKLSREDVLKLLLGQMLAEVEQAKLELRMNKQ